MIVDRAHDFLLYFYFKKCLCLAFTYNELPSLRYLFRNLCTNQIWTFNDEEPLFNALQAYSVRAMNFDY